MMDVYADKKAKTITILYDRPMLQELLGLEYIPKKRQLFFVFQPGKLPFGAPLKDDVAKIMEKVETVTLIHMDLATKKPVSGMEVPLTKL